MNYCKECGHSLKENARFCAECGTEVSKPQPTGVPPQQEHSQSTQPHRKTRKPWTKKQKLAALVTGLTILLLVIGYQAGAALTDKDRLIEKFNEAIKDQDNQKVADMLTSSDSALSISEDTVKPMVSYFNENEDYHEFVIDSLKNQSEILEQNEDNYDNPHLFSLKKDGKTAFLFDNYNIVIKPFYFNVGTNLPETTIYLEGEKVATTDSESLEQEIGPVLPGTYELKTTFENDFVTLENHREIELIDLSDQNLYTEVYLEAGDVYLNTDYDHLASKVSYYVNDEVVESDEDGARFGPISMDGSATAHAVLEFPWGEIETEQIEIDDDSINLPVDSLFSESVKNDIMNAVHTYAQDWANAYQELDHSQFSNVSDELLEVLSEDIAQMKDANMKWVGTYKSSLFDLDSFDLEYNDETYTAIVETSLHYNSATVSADDEEVKKENKEYEREYELTYDESNNAWVVNDYYSLFWGYSAENEKELNPAEE
ncbi:zinc-ribbon domain-containing protein [Virgibacillus sp. MSP4-1]|uniref:zinc ribbon domain-containing protein n=1 Tax=Virgibacillus sp. MSP4-1 TaxID=2700081 RepID=UPI0003A57532|nr:zinc-ribbon domain-containing protein [Virgibacillus sp. MSP4-1]QHS23039.1 zinc-ribbon domain-containing protein [Virgibacillus sp. MSP4-1]